jgi:hypothetical protein
MFILGQIGVTNLKLRIRFFLPPSGLPLASDRHPVPEPFRERIVVDLELGDAFVLVGRHGQEFRLREPVKQYNQLIKTWKIKLNRKFSQRIFYSG